MPVATVVIAAYNAEAHIEQAVHSVLAQTIADIELVVVDDGSSDGTSSIVEEIARSDNRARLHKRQRNRGKCEARNLGISVARGDWIAILDSDDWFAPNRLEKLVALGQAHASPVVTDNQNFFLDGDSRVWRTLFKVRGPSMRRISAAEFVALDMPGTSGTAGLLQPVLQRSFIQKNDIHYDTAMRTGEDFEFLMRCLHHFPHLQYVSEPMYNYRIRQDSDSRSRSNSDLVNIISSNDRVICRYSGANSKAVVTLLNKRGRRLRHLLVCKELAEAIQSGDLAAIASKLFRRPMIVPFSLLLIARKTIEWCRFPKPRLERSSSQTG